MGVMASNYESRNGVGTNKRVTNVEYVLNFIDAMFPVGAILMSANNVNPGTHLQGTTWVAWGSGRVPVGINTADTDFNTVEKTGGAKTHTLTIAEMPSHNHTYEWPRHDARGAGGYTGYTINNPNPTKATINTGGGGAHNNLQPYITCYMWKRTV